MKFEFLEHTADIKFRAYGHNLNEVFANAGLAMFEAVTDTSTVKQLIRKEFSLQANDLKSLLYDFLEELLILHESENLLFSKFTVKIKDNTLRAVAWGEQLRNHELKCLIKAVTYSEMVITDKMAQVVLDI